MTDTSPTPQLDALVLAEPDLVDRIFDYLLAEFPQIAGRPLDAARQAVREEFAGQEVYIAARSSERLAVQVLALFNGRNASEVARRLNISRASVYRYLKQPGGRKSQFFLESETGGAVRSATTAPTAQKRD